jgi:hypothetical protein
MMIHKHVMPLQSNRMDYDFHFPHRLFLTSKLPKKGGDVLVEAIQTPEESRVILRKSRAAFNLIMPEDVHKKRERPNCGLSEQNFNH